MAMLHSRLPQIGKAETRSVTVSNWPGVPDGEYGFIELYCDDPTRDCQRVSILVIGKDSGEAIWAAISYGWESQAFYEQRTGIKELAQIQHGTHLDPLNPQSPFAVGLLAVFNWMLKDAAYVERLKRHYTLFKAELRSKPRRSGKRKRPQER